MGFNMTTSGAVFWSVLGLMVLIVADQLVRRHRSEGWIMSFKAGCQMIAGGMVDGARNMVSVSIAVAAAGIIVGAVASTGLSNALIGIVEMISGGNIYSLLILTALLCLLLGMGLPTTANYLVVASIMAPVLSQLGNASGLELPLIAVHLFVFYFGLMADVTPPVGLAAYAAAAISRADPIQTGVQAFIYSIRTAILPFVFIFNLDLILYKVTSPLEAALIFAVGIIAILSFTTLTFRWFITRLSLLEMIALAILTAALMRPDFVMDKIWPRYEPFTDEQLEKGIPSPRVRLFIEKDSEYGLQKKLVTFIADKGKVQTRQSMGFNISDNLVTDVSFLGKAEKAGLEVGDKVVRMERFREGQPDPKYVFLPVLLFLWLLAWQHKIRSRKVLLTP